MFEINTFLRDMNFWVLVSFLGFLGIAFRPLKNNLLKMLDVRTAQIKEEFFNAQQMHLEAEELYKHTQKSHVETMAQIEEIFELAEQEVLYLQEKMEEEKKFFLQLKEHLFFHRMEHNYRKAQEEVRRFLIVQAFQETLTVLRKKPQDGGSFIFLNRFKKSLYPC